MKTSSLHALVIDRHLGELTPEAAELLDLHLASNAEARAEVERILASLSAMHDAVLRHPELAHVPPALVEKGVASSPRRFFVTPWLVRAAAVALLALVTGVMGYHVGQSESRTSAGTVETPVSSPRKASPWARYRMSFDPAGEGMQVVRVDTQDLKTNSIP
ncbi:MAG: hypothetical protein IAE77_17830 [Prosthecobacter sp.]|jgi:anti-sigma factor RsiW|uniref:anti-sigma factor family protein n=1 Tax=Prosthecobacter sp. TaxID=1965333 RepID=UPI001A0014D1|nr:hypothetical protein [Prosthecobacter sp.]MBE2285325.1 hypothetical protein [Prosthecobacter sp.]